MNKLYFLGTAFLLAVGSQAFAQLDRPFKKDCGSWNTNGITGQISRSAEGEYHVVLNARLADGANGRFESMECKPAHESLGVTFEVSCTGIWDNGRAGEARIESADGVLNVVIFQLPGESKGTALVCH